MTSLLEKEKEFHKLNAELEERTRVLMHEVDSVMKIQNSIVNETKKNQSKPKYEHIKTNSTYDSGEKWENYEADEKNTGISGFSKCLKTKIVLLQSELDDLKSQYKTKCNEVKQLHTDISKLDEEKTKWQQSSFLNRDQKEKISNQLTVLNAKLQSKEVELLSLRKENETLKKELKNSNMNNSNNEVKLNKILDENEKYKTSLKNAKLEEKDLRDNFKKQISDLTSINKRLEKQVTELTNGFKKQMMLVDNLKKQKMYLESAKLIQISEEEFSRILEWKPSE